jgi:hypothetical protein
MPATSRTSIFPTQIHSDGNGIQLRNYKRGCGDCRNECIEKYEAAHAASFRLRAIAGGEMKDFRSSLGPGILMTASRNSQTI